ncbi:MAG TPA: ABC transporter ATP-binding protein [Anaeromyxobacteraceae bacterium]|nr:ABC transporter ATP-binding protein [Anaeromyxobacteraceae bacterium]
MLKRLRQRLSARHLLVPSRAREGVAKLAARRVGHRFRNDVVALQNVDIDVHSGEFVCLLGPSGCGKSTLLYALAGLVKPSGGHISLDGKDVTGPGPDRMLVFQEPALFPWLTVRQNLVFVLRGRRMSRADAEARAAAFIERVGLRGFERALPHELSGGMRMRVALARALAMDPSVLLMDEPFGALDAQTRASMHDLLQQIWVRDRKTVVFVTHNIREALVLGDRVVVMAGQPGRVLQDFEVRLPRPRDPDDEALVEMSRRIRAMLGRVQRIAETPPPIGGGKEVADEERADPGAGRVPDGAPPPVGAGV